MRITVAARHGRAAAPVPRWYRVTHLEPQAGSFCYALVAYPIPWCWIVRAWRWRRTVAAWFFIRGYYLGFFDFEDGAAMTMAGWRWNPIATRRERHMKEAQRAATLARQRSLDHSIARAVPQADGHP